MASGHVQKATAWVNHQVEKEGIARLTITILLLTTVAMLAFTWGYAEGVHNTQSEMAEQIRLNADTRRPSTSEHSLPSIADLRSRSQQQQEIDFKSPFTRTADADELLLRPDTHTATEDTAIDQPSPNMHAALESATVPYADAQGHQQRGGEASEEGDDAISFDEANSSHSSSDVRQDSSTIPRPQEADEHSSGTEGSLTRDYGSTNDDYAG